MSEALNFLRIRDAAPVDFTEVLLFRRFTSHQPCSLAMSGIRSRRNTESNDAGLTSAVAARRICGEPGDFRDGYRFEPIRAPTFPISRRSSGPQLPKAEIRVVWIALSCSIGGRREQALR